MKNISKLNDIELFTLVKRSNSKALEILFKKYYLKLCDFSISYVKTVSLAEEVVSDVFLNIWLNRNKITIKTNVKSYLYTSVRNRAINYLIKEQRKWESIEVIDKEEGIIDQNSPYIELTFSELENVIESLIQKLPPKRQLVFRMNRINGLKYKEIAEVLSISINTVQNHMIKAVEYITKHYPQIKSLYIILICIFFI